MRRQGIVGLTATVAGLGIAVPGVSPATAQASMAPIGLVAKAGPVADGFTTYPVEFMFTNDTPYKLHIWPEWQSGDECWDNPGNPAMTLGAGETRSGLAWTQERHLHCFIAFRTAIVGPDGEHYLTPSQPFYIGREAEGKSTFTFNFPDSPKDAAWVWAPWGYWPLPEQAVGVDMRKNSALFFRVTDQLNGGNADKCRDHNDSRIYCHVTISTKPPGSIRPWEMFQKGVKPGTARRTKALPADPKAWPTIAAIQGEGCLVRGIIDRLCTKTDSGTTDFTGLTVQEKGFKLDEKNIQVVGETVESGTWPNNTPADQKYTFSRSLTVGEDSSSTSTQSHSVGGSVSFETKAKWDMKVSSGSATFAVAVNTDHKWESSETRTTSRSETKTSTYEVNVPKKSTVTWRILQNAIKTTDAQYTADVVIGPDQDAVEPVSSPMFPNSLISPMAEQPCLALGIGNTDVPFSLLALKKYAQDTGGYGDRARTKRFLDSAANFSSSGQCPGMPKNYPSRATFKGTGMVRDMQKGMSAACTYFSPIKSSGPSAQPPRGGVVKESDTQGTIYDTAPKCDGPRTGYPIAFDASEDPYDARDTIEGTEYGDLLMAKDRSGVTLLGGDSRDILEGGSGTGNVLDGQDGDDIVTGGDAAETLRGGPGADNVSGGKGRDTLLDIAGVGNLLDGGAGEDRLVSRAGRTTLIGGAGADTLVAHSGTVGLLGGAGEDQYLIKSGAKRVSVTERPGEQRDVVKAWRSFTLPSSVEVLRLQGSKDLKARGTYGHQVLIGNAGDNVIAGKEGFDRMVGGEGRDTIKLSAVGFDKATGGPGRDRYVLAGEPTATESLVRKGQPFLAHEITDFTVGRDTLVLSEKVHGPEVRQLAKVFRVFDPSKAATPTGSGPALVVNTKTGVVSYDSDERGRSPERVLVRLPQGTKLTPKEVEIR